jgi:hypothetical protein
MFRSSSFLAFFAAALSAQTPATGPVTGSVTGSAPATTGVTVPATVPATVKVFPLAADAPVRVESIEQGPSLASPRGGAVVVDIHSALTLKNTGTRRVRGITLLVMAQEVSAGGKGSVTVPSLDVAPGELFSVKIDLQLLRPNGATGALAEVSVDGLLFDDLQFYGPNKLNSRRMLTVWELEARRDRKYFASVLANHGAEGLREQMRASLDRQSRQPSVEVARGRVSALEPSRPMEFAFVRVPDAPVEALNGHASVTATDVRSPQIQLKNVSTKAVRQIEMGWIVRERSGAEFYAAALPSKVALAPGQTSNAPEDVSLRLTAKSGKPIVIDGLKGYVSNVEFADGAVWVAPRAGLEGLTRVSPEEERLAQIYRKRGINALIAELKRFGL